MARRGVLSDGSIKEQYPEMFPLDIGVQQAMFAPQLRVPKMNKANKKVKHATDIARFPIYDIKNFARLATPQNSIQAGFEGVLQYRSKIGSSNVPANLQQGYAEQKEQVYTMRKPDPVKQLNVINKERYTTSSGTLSLGKIARRQGVPEFNRKFKNERTYIHRDTKPFLMNLGNDATIQQILNQALPPPLKGTIPHYEALAKVRDFYKGSEEDQEIIARAERATRTQDALPDRSDFGNRILDPFGRFSNPFAVLEDLGETEEQELVNPDERN